MNSNKFIGMIQPKNLKNKNDNKDELHDVGCLGKISNFHETNDKRFLIELKGIIRFKIVNELISKKKYRECEISYENYQNDLVETKENIRFSDLELIFKDLKNLSKNIKHINIILGKIGKKKFVKSEVKSRKFARRSIVVKKDLKKNKIITENDIIALRPNIGISVENWNKVLGKRTKKNLTKNKTLAMKDLK